MMSKKPVGETKAALVFAAALLATASAAPLNAAWADAPKPSASSCFFITEWRGWSSPAPNVIYLKVNMKDVYQVDLSGGSPMLQAPDVHLVSRTHGPTTICSAIDLQLEVSDSTGFGGGLGPGLRFGSGGGFSVPLIASKLTKLTPEQIAAIPKKYLPG